MVGIGGVVGSLAGGYLTQYDLPYWSFFITSMLGFLISLSGFLMSKELENDGEELVEMNTGSRAMLNIKNVWQGFKLPELWRSILFFVIMGSFIPSFSTFLYYYETDVLGISQIVISWLSVISYFCLFLSVFMYQALLKEVDIRWMMFIGLLINMFGAAASIMFVKGIYLGMPPVVFLLMSSTVTDTLYGAYTQLPAMVLFAKIIPESVESSMFALLTGLINLSNLFAAPELGVFINTFVGVTSDNLQELWVLYCVQIGCCMIPMMFIWLLPGRAAVALAQAKVNAEVEAFNETLRETLRLS
jgi:Na+/melibiose symporter-like transporter